MFPTQGKDFCHTNSHMPPLKIYPRIYTFLTGVFSDYKMPENRQKTEKSHPWDKDSSKTACLVVYSSQSSQRQNLTHYDIKMAVYLNWKFIFELKSGRVVFDPNVYLDPTLI